MENNNHNAIFRFQEFCKLGAVKDENFSMQLKMYSLFLDGAKRGGFYALTNETNGMPFIPEKLERFIDKIESYQVHAVCNIDAEKFKNWIKNCKYLEDDKKSEEAVRKIWFSFLDELNKPDNLEKNKQ